MRVVLVLILACGFANAAPTLLDQGYSSMYNLDFPSAHRAFAEWERLHPEDPLGPASNAGAVLFSEFARMHVLESEFFVDDDNFKSHRNRPPADPASKREFETDLARTQHLAQAILSSHPDDRNALFASLLGEGLQADYLSLIEERNLAALSVVKQGRLLAEKLLSAHPDCYDAHLAIGVENYLLSLKPAPLRWMLRMGGAQTDKDSGIAQLKITAEKGRYLLPYARLLLAVADLRDGNRSAARATLTWLVANFPGNPLYKTELNKLR